MIEQLTKKGKLHKGQYLSIAFFEKQIEQNIQDIRLRIRDLVDFERKRNWKKKIILEEQEYLDMYFNMFKFTYGTEQNDNMIGDDEKIYNFIDKKFVADYPIFYKPKWMIWLSGRLSIKKLAILNHLAFGYFYRKSDETDLPQSVLQQSKSMGIFQFVDDIQMKLEIGTIKLIDSSSKQRNQFCYRQYILQGPIEQQQNIRKLNPRKKFNKIQLKINTKQMDRLQGVCMTLDKLRTKKQISLQAYNCPIYQNQSFNQKILEQFKFKLSKYYWSRIKNLEPQKKEMSLIMLRQKQFQKRSQEEQFMKNNLISFQKSAEMVTFLQKIPKFTFKLSKQQKQILSLNGNIIIIGRSGTGKTTCAVLRLFCLETMVKSNNFQIEQLRAKQFQQNSKMKNIFITASPFLSIQLRKDYNDRVNKLRFQLQKLQAKNQQQQKQSLMIEANSQQQQKHNDQMKMLKQNFNKIRQNKVCSLYNLKAKDFPGFFTIKDLLIMLDGVYNDSFFQRNEKHQLYIGQDQFKINNNQKSKFFIRYNGYGNYQQSCEIQYESFYEFFWTNQIQKKKKNKYKLNPLVVWSQIFSTIQGSTQAHKCPKSHISEEMYVVSSKSKFLSQEQKRFIFSIFQLYSSWKHHLNYFDQTDLVNYLLRKILRNSYLGPTINCLFIDQVQDLTPATIYLVSQIPSNNVFYAGDTAQSIFKGVNFKFADIKLLFKNKQATQFIDKQEPQIKQLTVNFRSHDQILKLANCFIRIIEVLFPKTIDNLRKQTSSVNGPKPVVIQKHQDIISILNYNKKQQFDFSGQQAIIVRDQEKKKQVEQIYPNAFVLTISQCKGLQFDNIILWEISPQRQNQFIWKILQIFIVQQDHLKNKDLKALVNYEGQIDNIQTILMPTNKLKQYNISKYEQLCFELKILYTAITRAKQLLIIYNSFPSKLLSILQKINLVQKFSQKYIQSVREYKQKQKLKFNGQIEEMKAQEKQWKTKGINLYAKQDFDNALVCFKKAGDKRLCLQTQAKIKIKQARNINKNLQIMTKLNQVSRDEIKQLKRRSKLTYLQAVDIFSRLKQYQQMGDIFCVIQQYKKAIIEYQKVNEFEKMANCYELLKEYIKAAELYENSQNYNRVIRCLETNESYVLCLIKLIQFNSHFKDYSDKKQYLKQKIIGAIQNKLVVDLQKIQYKIRQKKLIINKSNQASKVNLSQKSKLMKQQLWPRNEKKEQTHQNLHQISQIQIQNRKIIKSHNLIQKIPIQEIKIALFFDKEQSNIELNSIQAHLNNPLNSLKLIVQFERRGYFQLCLIFGSFFNQFSSFEDYFVTVVFGRYLKRRKQNFGFVQTEFLSNQISNIDQEKLNSINESINIKIIGNIYKNLALAGFYQYCEKFVTNRSIYYVKTMLKQKFVKRINERLNIKINNDAEASKPILYMRENSWYQKLKKQEIIYSLQILYQFYDSKHMIQIHEQSLPFLTQQEYGNAWRKITKIQQQLKRKAQQFQNKIKDLQYFSYRNTTTNNHLLNEIQRFQDIIYDKKKQEQQLQEKLYQLQKQEHKILKDINLNEELQKQNQNNIQKEENLIIKQNKQKKKNKKNKKYKQKQNTNKIQDQKNKIALQNNQQNRKQLQQDDDEQQSEINVIKTEIIIEENKSLAKKQEVEITKQQNNKNVKQSNEKNKDNNKKNKKNKKKNNKKNKKNKKKNAQENNNLNQIVNDQIQNQSQSEDDQTQRKFNQLIQYYQKTQKIDKDKSQIQKLRQYKIQLQKKRKDLLKQKQQASQNRIKLKKSLENTTNQITQFQNNIVKLNYDLDQTQASYQNLQGKVKFYTQILNRIQQRNQQYKKNGPYFNKFMRRQREKKNVYQSIGHVKLSNVSNFLNNFYTNNLLSNSELQRLFKFSMNQANYINICQIVTLALSILSRYEDPFNNDFSQFVDDSQQKDFNQINQQQYEDYDQKIQFQQYEEKIRQFFCKILEILKNYRSYNNFYEILIGFFNCRTFYNEVRLNVLKDFVIIDTQTVNKFSLITKQLQNSLTYFDFERKYMIGATQNINYLIAQFIRRSFKKLFPKSGELLQYPKPDNQSILNMRYEQILKKNQKNHKKISNNIQSRTLHKKIQIQYQKTQLINEYERKYDQFIEKRHRQERKMYENISKAQYNIQSFPLLNQKIKQLQNQIYSYQELSQNHVGRLEFETMKEKQQEKKQLQKIIKTIQSQKQTIIIDIKTSERQLFKKLRQMQKFLAEIQLSTSILIQNYYSKNAKIKDQIPPQNIICNKNIYGLFKEIKLKQQQQKKIKAEIISVQNSLLSLVQKVYYVELESCLKIIRLQNQKTYFQRFKETSLKIRKNYINKTIKMLQQKINYLEYKKQSQQRKIRIQQFLEKLKKQRQQQQQRQRKILQQKRRKQEEQRLRKAKIQAERKKLQQQNRRRKQQQQKSKDCSICLTNLNNLKLTCGHQFHLSCIMQFLAKGNNKNCPLCRANLLSQQKVIGTCSQCNKNKKGFNLYNFYMRRENNLFCDTCQISSQPQVIKNQSAYSNLSRRFLF